MTHRMLPLAHRIAGALPQRGARVWQRLSQRSSSNFTFAFMFLGKAQREALSGVYKFCRIVDDIVDERPPGDDGVAQAEAGLQLWRDEVGRIYEGTPHTDLGKTLQASQVLFKYPREAFDEIIEGCAMDLRQDTYATQDELRLYCYRVASCVGFLCIAIFGDQSPQARTYAEHLGLALQYTNILRDIAEDADRGRIYVPLELLHAHDLSPHDIFARRYTENFISMATSFADMAEREYQAAWAARPQAHARALVPAEIMGHTYHRILHELRAAHFNVFVQRTALKRRDKVRVAASVLGSSAYIRIRPQLNSAPTA